MCGNWVTSGVSLKICSKSAGAKDPAQLVRIKDARASGRCDKM